MANKTEITTKVKSAYTTNAGITDRLEVENALVNDADSILESVYATPINETQATESIFSVAVAGIEYDLNVSKVGRNVHIAGTITNATANAYSTLLDIVDNDYKCTEDKEFISVCNIGSEAVRLRVRNISALSQDNIAIKGILLPSETVVVNITYSTEL